MRDLGSDGSELDRDSIEDQIRQSRAAPAEPGRVGHHDILRETIRLPRGDMTSVYQIRGGRVVVVRALEGSYRDDVAAALLDAVDDLAEGTDLGPVVHLRPINIAGFPLDRAVVLGPAANRCFPGTPTLTARSVQVLPVHRSEVIDGEEGAGFWFAMSAKCLGGIDGLWARQPRPRAAVRLLDDWPGGPLRRGPSLFSVPARNLMEAYLLELPRGVRALVRDARGYEMVLHREWDRLVGTLAAPDGSPNINVVVPRHLAWEVFSPLFHGGNPDPAAFAPVASTREANLLEMTYSSRDCGHADLPVPQVLDDCLARVRNQITRDAGNFATFTARSGAVVQVLMEADGRLWLETPSPATHQVRGRHVTIDEAERMITVLARQDRSAVEELGNLETRNY
jgi:hypothetical protein